LEQNAKLNLYGTGICKKIAPFLLQLQDNIPTIDPFGVDLVVDLRSWIVLLSRSQVRLPFVPISMGKSKGRFVMALNEASPSKRRNSDP